MQILSARYAIYMAECKFLSVCEKALNERIYILINETGGVGSLPNLKMGCVSCQTSRNGSENTPE